MSKDLNTTKGVKDKLLKQIIGDKGVASDLLTDALQVQFEKWERSNSKESFYNYICGLLKIKP